MTPKNKLRQNEFGRESYYRDKDSLPIHAKRKYDYKNDPIHRHGARDSVHAVVQEITPAFQLHHAVNREDSGAERVEI